MVSQPQVAQVRVQFWNSGPEAVPQPVTTVSRVFAVLSVHCRPKSRSVIITIYTKYYNYIDQFSIYKYRCSTTITTITTSPFRGNTPTQQRCHVTTLVIMSPTWSPRATVSTCHSTSECYSPSRLLQHV